LRAALNHFANHDYWFHYRRLPPEIRAIADEKFKLLKADTSSSFATVEKGRSSLVCSCDAFVSRVGKDRKDGLVWFWIGGHAEYERLIAAAMQ
jgi:hypothetical protein